MWDLKKSLEDVGNGLEIRLGLVGQVLKDVLESYKLDAKQGEVVSVWMTEEEGVEEKREERDVRRVVEGQGKKFRLWTDEKYYIDEYASPLTFFQVQQLTKHSSSRDIPFDDAADLPDIFTSYRKQVEPLRDAPRKPLPKPNKLPPLPAFIPPQPAPFCIPPTLSELTACLTKPLSPDFGLTNPPTWPSNATSAHPFDGGETTGHARIADLLTTSSMSTYKDTRNGLLGTDFSTKLSAWLALGCVTARQVHKFLLDFEEGRTELGKGAQGYGKGENTGTAAVRFELLWRDYMRLCTRKFGPRLFPVEGFRQDTSYKWKHPQKDPETKEKVARFLEGRTGIGLIDASMRELFLTGYTSNRARQNVASFLAKHLGIDWRIGAEWYESLLIDYDLSSNWGNWQYVAGVGNDPRGEARVFNPIKQAFDYDPHGQYVKNWVVELRGLESVEYVFQAWKVPEQHRREVGLDGIEWVERPLKRIEFRVGGPAGRGRGGGKGGKAGGSRGGGGGGGGGGGRSSASGGAGHNKGNEKPKGHGRMGSMGKAQWSGVVIVS